MKIKTIEEAKKHIGERLYWDEESNRYIITRGAVLDDVYRRQLAFDDTQDYKPLRDYKNLRTTYDEKL